MAAVRNLPFVRAEPAPDCVLQEFVENTCGYACRYWMDDVQRDDAARQRGAQRNLVRPTARAWRFRCRRANVTTTENNEDRLQRKQDEDYAQRIDALSRVDVFRALDGGRIDRLSRRLRHVVFGPGEVILRQGDPGRLALRHP